MPGLAISRIRHLVWSTQSDSRNSCRIIMGCTRLRHVAIIVRNRGFDSRRCAPAVQTSPRDCALQNRAPSMVPFHLLSAWCAWGVRHHSIQFIYSLRDQKDPVFGALVLDSKLRQNQAPTCHASSTDLGGAEQRQNGNITLIHAAVFDWLGATFAGAQQPAGDRDLATIRGR